jgi:ankyrin repeat protein
MYVFHKTDSNILCIFELFSKKILYLKTYYGHDKNYNQAFLHSCKTGNLQLINYFFEKKICLEYYDNKYKSTNFCWAAYYGHLTVIKFLYKHGANINAINIHGDNALLLASQEGHLSVIEYLHKKNADLQTENYFYDNALTLTAFYCDDLKIIKYLYENGVNIHCNNNKYGMENNAMITFAMKGNLEAIKYLVENNADIHSKYQNDETNVIMSAASSGNLQLVKYLHENNADIYCKNDNKTNVLMFAAAGGNLEIVKYLHENNINTNDMDDLKYNAIRFAAESNHSHIVKYLYENGSDISTICLNLIENNSIISYVTQKLCECEGTQKNEINKEMNKL